jgi:hypothetical protein
MKIWLDDDRTPPDVDGPWLWVTNAVDAVDQLFEAYDLNEEVEEISLDHDLADFADGKELTGLVVLQEIERRLESGEGEIAVPKKFSIHSANPVGRKNMQAAIDSIERMRC